MHPITSLGEQAIALRAALKACAGHARPRPVHKLRTATRRIEAVLALLPHTRLPQAEHESRRFRKTAKPIRRAAGLTRDLDVQLELLAGLSHRGAPARDLATWTAGIQHHRKQSARKLSAEIASRGPGLLRALDHLELALAPALDEPVSNTTLRTLAHKLFADANARTTAHALATNPRALHDLRKSAKLARYIAELAGTPSARRSARRFHTLQQKIGAWHDWLLLHESASERLAPKEQEQPSPLLLTLVRKEERARAAALKLAQQSL